MSLLDNNTYYPVGSIVAYPASNSVDSGKLMSELNLRNVTINITDLNYVVGPNPGGYDIEFVNNEILIQPGKAIINGFDVTTDIAINYRLPEDSELYTGTKYAHKYNGYALLCLHTIFDSLNNLSGNIQVGDKWVFEGIQVCYVTADEYEAHENEYLLLGGVKPDGTVKINDEKFDRIDAKYILVRLVPDEETGIPPLQSTDLLTFINQFMHGYWLKKNGDTEYGDLLFRVMPNGYLEPWFNYHNEVPLDQKTQYTTKIAKTQTADSVDGYINIKHYTPDGHECQTNMFPMGFCFKDDIPDDDTRYNVKVYYDHNKGDNQFIIRISGEDNKTDGKIRLDNLDICSKSFFETHFVNNYIEVYVTDADNNGVTTWLMDPAGDIVSQTIAPSTLQHKITISALRSWLKFNTALQEAYIHVRDNPTSDTWKNVLEMYDNVEINNGLYAHGYIVAGTTKRSETLQVEGEGEFSPTDPSKIKVPDYYNNAGNYRPIKEGDIVALGQVWSAVYNDIAEMFDVKDLPEPGTIVAINSKGEYETADFEKHNNVIGIVSTKPAYILGDRGPVPIAVAGRVPVKYYGDKPNFGDWVCLSPEKPGYATKTWANVAFKYRVGIVTDILADNLVEVLVRFF